MGGRVHAGVCQVKRDQPPVHVVTDQTLWLLGGNGVYYNALPVSQYQAPPDGHSRVGPCNVIHLHFCTCVYTYVHRCFIWKISHKGKCNLRKDGHSVLASSEIKGGGVRTSKHSCGFTDHITEKLSNKGWAAPFSLFS